ncbi:MAG: 2-hydroxyglutaryl-CoA dehydratase, partial [Chrysiogenales bacterium]
MFYLGIDIGSLSCDAVIIDRNAAIVAASVVPTGARNREAIARATDEVLRMAGIGIGARTAMVSTGYGR